MKSILYIAKQEVFVQECLVQVTLDLIIENHFMFYRPVLVDKILAFWKKRNGIRQEFHVFNFQAPTPTEIEIDMYQESSLQE